MLIRSSAVSLVCSLARHHVEDLLYRANRFTNPAHTTILSRKYGIIRQAGDSFTATCQDLGSVNTQFPLSELHLSWDETWPYIMPAGKISASNCTLSKLPKTTRERIKGRVSFLPFDFVSSSPRVRRLVPVLQFSSSNSWTATSVTD